MKRLFLLSLLALTVLVLPAQQKRTGTKAKTTAQTRKTSTARKTTASKTKAKKAPAKKTTTKKKTTAKKDAYSNASIRGLQKQRSQIQQKIKQQEKALRANQADVKKRLQNLMVINTEIGEQIGRASCRERV